MHNPPSTLKTASYLSFLSLIGLGSSLYMQHGMDMLPCTWCVIARVLLLFTLISTVIWGLTERYTQIGLRITQLIITAGIVVSGWHLYDIYKPHQEESATCGSEGMMQWLDGLSVVDHAPWFLAPMGDCIRDAVTLYGIPLPLLGFFLFLMLLEGSVRHLRN